MKHLNVLIACEESQAECSAFRALGHNAFSCDIQPCRKGGHKEWHICSDVTPLLEGRTQFYTMDGRHHHLSRWHLIIAHPPCTYLCKISSIWLRREGRIDPDRYEKLLKGREFFFKCLNAKAPYVAVENPLPMRLANLPPPSCYLDPSWFGVKYTKKTLFWLKNLPPIMPQLINPDAKCYVRASRGKYRSRTFPQVAEAIARQWSEICVRELNINLKKNQNERTGLYKSSGRD